MQSSLNEAIASPDQPVWHPSSTAERPGSSRLLLADRPTAHSVIMIRCQRSGTGSLCKSQSRRTKL